jgi:hypothetical protein
MARIIQFKRYANTILNSIIGADGELIIDRTNKTLTIHDGVSAGGSKVATETFVSSAISQINYNSGVTFAQEAYDTANLALTTSATALSRATGASSNTVYLQGALNAANASITSLSSTNLSQNTNITGATTLAQNAFNKANVVSSNVAHTQAALDTANARISSAEAVNLTQNVSIFNAFASSAASFNIANTVSANTVYLQGALNSSNANIALIFGVNSYQNTVLTLLNGNLNLANANINYIFGVDTAQNTNITNVTTLTQASFNKANTASANSIYLQGGLNTANASLVIQQGINTSQNSTIQVVFDRANTDATTLTANAGSYGDSTTVPVTTIAANGRVTAISTQPIAGITIGTTTIAPGATATSLSGLSSIAVTANPTTGLQLATKQYVDSYISNTNYHPAANVATSAALTSAYNNGSSGLGADLTNNGSQSSLVIDGYSTKLYDRVLVKDQALANQNGIYVVNTVGSVSTNWVLIRASDYDQVGDVGSGDYIFITNGNINGNTSWVQTTATAGIVIGTTPLVFSQVSKITSYTAADPLFLNGTQFTLGTTGTANTYGNLSHVPVITTDVYGRVSGVINTAIEIPIAKVTGLQQLEDSQNTNITNVTTLTQASFNKANTASSNTVYLQGGLDTANASLVVQQGVNASQNANITIVQGVDVGQNAAISIIQGVNLTQNASIAAAFGLANTLQGGLNTANANIIVAQGIDTTQNATITIIQGVDLTQNASISAAFGLANTLQGGLNTANANIVIQQGVNATQNASITIIQGVDTTQNASISAAFGLANTLQGGLNTANANITILQNVNTTQNTTIATIQGVDTTQNSIITVIQNTNVTQNASISAAFGLANTLQGGLNTANANIVVAQGIDNTQNTNINIISILAQAAFDQANAANIFAHNGSAIATLLIPYLVAAMDAAIGNTSWREIVTSNTTSSFVYASDVYVSDVFV